MDETGNKSESNNDQNTVPPDSTEPHTDIKRVAWIEKLFPEKLRPYAYLARIDRPVGIWLLLLPCLWSVALATGGLLSFGFDDIKLVILFTIGAIVMRTAGCVINDLWDRKLDAEVERTMDRPLASGAITAPEAFLFACGLMVIGFFILVRLSTVSILLGVMAIPLIVLYPLMKRFTWWPQAFLGITFNLGALMGWGAVTDIIQMPALLLYAGGILWTLGYDTIYAHQDKADDMLIGVKSTALKFGEKSKTWVTLFYGGAGFFILLAFMAAGAGLLSLLALGVAGAHLYFQLRVWKLDNPASSLAVFRSNRDFGLLILAAALI